MIEQAGIGQTELMVRTIAEGLRKFFRLILKLVVKHQDVPRTVRLRGEWVQYDPRSWNSDMDCTVNTGLGAGTRERDMQMVQFILGMQEKLLASLGPVDNPFVSPDNLYASLQKLVQAAGMKTPDMFFTKPDPEKIAAKAKAMAEQPSPEMMKVQAQAEAKKAELQMTGQIKAAEMQQSGQAERANLEAEMQLKREQMMAETQLARERMMAEMQLKREQMQAEMQLKMLMPQEPMGGGNVQFGGAVG